MIATPAGTRFRMALRPIMGFQAGAVLGMIRRGQRIDLSAWDQPMAEMAGPHLTPYWLRGAASCIREAQERYRPKSLNRLAGLLSKKLIGSPTARLSTGFGRYSPEAIRAVDSLALTFAESTNRTSEHRAEVAREMTRQELREGLAQNEALDRLTARVSKIFRSPKRAALIARTEVIRALCAGKFETAKRLGFVRGKKWRAGTRSCDRCQALEKMGAIALDQPFDVDPKGGPYAVTLYPPLHPTCDCGLGLAF